MTEPELIEAAGRVGGVRAVRVLRPAPGLVIVEIKAAPGEDVGLTLERVRRRLELDRPTGATYEVREMIPLRERLTHPRGSEAFAHDVAAELDAMARRISDLEDKLQDLANPVVRVSAPKEGWGESVLAQLRGVTHAMRPLVLDADVQPEASPSGRARLTLYCGHVVPRLSFNRAAHCPECRAERAVVRVAP